MKQSLLRGAIRVVVQEYTDDTAELRRQLDSLGGMAALQEPKRQLQAIMELEQAVSAVRTHDGLLGGVLGFGCGVWGHMCYQQSPILRQSKCGLATCWPVMKICHPVPEEYFVLCVRINVVKHSLQIAAFVWGRTSLSQFISMQSAIRLQYWCISVQQDAQK